MLPYIPSTGRLANLRKRCGGPGGARGPCLVWWLAAGACLLVAAATSAAETAPSRGWTAPWNKPVVPERLTVVWTDTVLNQSGQRGVRGFGGRLMFYSADSDNPVRVHGRLMVYAFRDDGPTAEHCQPARCYVYTAEQLAHRYSKSRLGHSYSVWLPWGEVGGPVEKLSLVSRFEPDQGSVVLSESTRQVLPGVGPQVAGVAPGAGTPAGTFERGSSGRQAAYFDPRGPTVPGSLPTGMPPVRPRMSTATISLPSALARQAQAVPHHAQGARYADPASVQVVGEPSEFLGSGGTRIATASGGPAAGGGASAMPTARPAGPPAPPAGMAAPPAGIAAPQAGAVLPPNFDQLVEAVRQVLHQEQATGVTPGANFRPRTRRVLGAPIVRPRPDRGQSAQDRARWPSLPQPSPLLPAGASALPEPR